MGDPGEADAAAPTRSGGPVVNPASIQTINRLGLCALILTALLFYLLITTWPVLEDGEKAFRATNIFGFSCSWAPDRQMIFTVMLAGAVGSLTHTLTSFGD